MKDAKDCQDRAREPCSRTPDPEATPISMPRRTAVNKNTATAESLEDFCTEMTGYIADASALGLACWVEVIGTLDGGWEDTDPYFLYVFNDAVIASPDFANDTPGDYAALKPETLSNEEFNRFVQRYINTCRRDQKLSYDASNVIDLERIDSLLDDLLTLYEEIQALGYSDIDELSSEMRELWALYLEKKSSNSVCASVVLQFEQRLVMTRQAFRGTLKVSNGHSTAAMENVCLHLKLFNSDGDIATSHEFQINLESLDGFTGETKLGENWTLGAKSDGVATILFIPTRYAAPDKDELYYFGGTLSYYDPYTQTNVERDLQPVTMTVRPSPVLNLDYFMQRDLYGDDPLTEDVVEPVVPGEFSLLMRNTGYGDATNVKMTTKQPQIVENEKGLFVDFQIIGSTMNGKETSMGIGEKIINDFGTIPAGASSYVQWWLTSSLLGHFTQYDVSVTHVTSYDNPDLSLLDEVNIHPLIRSLTIDDSTEVPLLGFLADDHSDYNATPDHLYYTDGQVFEVSKAESASIELVAPSQYRLTVKPDFTGWTYGKVADPTGGRAQILSVVRESDSKTMYERNFWITDRTLIDGADPVMENMLHFADDIDKTETYLVTFAPCPSRELDVEFLDAPAADAGTLEVQVRHLDIRFNKPIVASTFTADDVQVCVQGEPLSEEYYSVAPIGGSDTDFRITFPDKFAAIQGGFFVVTVQCAEITDTEGFQGSDGRRCSWVYYNNPYFTITTTFAPAEVGALRFVQGTYDSKYDEMAPGYVVHDINPAGYHMFEAMPGYYIYADVPEGWTARWTVTNTDVQGKSTVTQPENPAIAYAVDVLMSDTHYHADFERQNRQVRIDEQFEGKINGRSYVIGGTVTGAHSGTYKYGDVLSLHAETTYGYTFEGWYLVTFPTAGKRDVMLISTNPDFDYEVTRKSSGEALRVLDIHGNKTDEFVTEAEACFDSPDFNWLMPLWSDRHDRFTYEFRKGWNWVSFNDETYTFSRFLNASVGKFDIIEENGRAFRYDSNLGWIGTAPVISPNKSYRVHCTADFTMLVNAITPVVKETPITLVEGWSWIGYTPRQALPVAEAFSEYTPTVNDVIKDYDGFAVFHGGSWKGTLKKMTPGVGYKYFTASPDSFTYNGDAEGEPVHATPHRVFSYNDPEPARGEYPDNMTLIAEVFTHDGHPVTASTGYDVLAFVDNECRGVGEFVDDTHVFMTIYGTEAAAAAAAPGMNRVAAAENVRFEVVASPEQLWKVESTTPFTLTPQGTMDTPVQIVMPDQATTGLDEITVDTKLYSARPNPVQTTLRLIGLTDRIHAWKLLDMSGRTVDSGEGYSADEGIDVSRHATGQYLLVLDTDFGRQTVQIIKN